MADKTIPVLKVLRGSVGIGTNTPEHVLDIQSGTPTLCVRSVSGSGNANVHIGEPNTTAYGLQLRWEGNLGNVFFDNRYNHATRPHMYFRMRVAGTPITAMTIDPAGNVGIGTTAPARKLHVLGGAVGIQARLTAASGWGTGLEFYDGDTSGRYWRIGTSNNVAGDFSFISGTSTGAAPTATRVTILKDGYVGIGTATPNNNQNVTDRVQLAIGNTAQVGGRASGTPSWFNISHGTYFDGTNWKYYSAADEAALIEGYNGGLYARMAVAGTNAGDNITWVTALTVLNTGYVHMDGAAQVRLTLGSQGTAGTNDANWIRGTGTSLGFNSAGGGFHWEVSGTQRMALDSSGNLTINGNISNTAASAYYYLNNVGTGNSGLYVAGLSSRMRFHVPASNYYEWEIGGAHKMRLDADGDLGIGTNGPTQKLHVFGNILFGSSSKLGFNNDINSFVIDGGGTYGIEIDGWYGASLQSRSIIGVFVDELGNVGIGPTATNPDATGSKLQISSGTTANAANKFYDLLKLKGKNNTLNAVGMLFSIESTAGAAAGLDYSKGGIVYGPTSGWGRGAMHFLQEASNTTADADISDSVMTILNDGNVGINDTTPTYKLDVNGTFRATGDVTVGGGTLYIGSDCTIYRASANKLRTNDAFYFAGAIHDSNDSAGTSGQVLTSTGTVTDWKTLSEISGVDGSGTANYIPKWTDGDTIGNSTVYNSGSFVGISTASTIASSAELLGVYSASTGHTNLQNASDTYGTIYVRNLSTTASTYQPYIILSDGGGNRGGLGLEYSTSKLKVHGQGGVSFWTGASFGGGTEKVVILADGSFGIGSGSVTGSSGGRLYFKSPSNVNGEQVGRIEWWNENGAGIMAKISCVRETSALAPAGLGFYTSANVDSTDNSGEGAWSQKMIINSAGNVGIGTTAPGHPLVVVTPTGDKGISLTNSSNVELIHMRQEAGDAGAIFLKDGGAVKVLLTSRPSNHSYFNVSGGNVGIGTTAPDVRLQIDAANGLPATTGTVPNGFLGFRSKTAGATHALFMGVSNVSPWGSWLQAQDGNALGTTYPLSLNPNGGNVGIGTTAPVAKLHVNGTTRFGSYVRFMHSDDTTQAGYIGSGNNLGFGDTNDLCILGTDSIKFTSNNGASDAMTIDVNGKVGIGTAAPSSKLEVYAADGDRTTLFKVQSGAAVDFRSGTSDNFRVNINSRGASRQTGIVFKNNGSIEGSLWNEGGTISIGSGDFTTPQFKVESSGLATFSGSVYFMGGLGVGTDSPECLLDLKKSIDGPVRLNLHNQSSNAAADATISFETNGQMDWGMGIDRTDGHFKIGRHNTLGTNTVVQLDGSGTISAPSVFIDASDGKVGLGGRTVPSTTLVIQGIFDGSATPSVSAPSNNTANKGIEIIREANDNSWGIGYTYGIDFAATSSVNSTNQYKVAAIYGAVESVPYYVAGKLGFYTTTGGNGALLEERMTIKGDGNVGIGTITPAQKLHVVGNQKVTGYLDVGAGATLGQARIFSDATNLILQAQNNGAIEARLTNTNLAISNNVTSFILDATASSFAGFNSNSNVGTALLSTGASTRVALAPNGVEKVSVLASGSVGIGTTSPTSTLSVSHATSNTAAIRVFRSSSLSTTYMEMGTVGGSGRLNCQGGSIAFQLNGTTNSQLSSNGNWGFKYDTAAHPTYDVQIGSYSIAEDRTLAILGDNMRTATLRLADENDNYGFDIRNNGASSRLEFVRHSNNSTGTVALVIERDTGEVGISTASPGAKLHVYNTATTSDGDGSATETLSGQDSILLYGHGGTNGQTYGSITWTGGETRRRAMIAAVAENTDPDHVGLAFYTQGTDGPGDFFESMRISRSGNVGIGTTSPGGILHIAAVTPTVIIESLPNSAATLHIDSTNAAILKLDALSTSVASMITFSASGADPFYIGRGAWSGVGNSHLHFMNSGGVTRMIIQTDGNVGIGTTAPSKKLHVYKGASGASAHSWDALVIEDNDNVALNLMTPNTKAASIFFTDPQGTNGQLSYSHVTDAFSFAPNATTGTKMVIASDGNVYLGGSTVTSSAGGRLIFKSPSNVNGEQVGRMEWWNENGAGIMAKISCIRETSAQAPGALGFYTSANVDTASNSSEGSWTEKMRITSAGKVGIGTNDPRTLTQLYAGAGSAIGNSRQLSLTDSNGTLATRVEVGMGYWHPTHTYQPVVLGAVVTDGAGQPVSDFYIATKSSTDGDVAPTERFRITKGGKVGIGTTAPNAPLVVAGAAGNQVIFRTNEATASQRAGGGFSSAGNATAASRYARMFLDPDGGDFSGVDYFTIEKFGGGHDNPGGEVKLINYSDSDMSFWVNTSVRAMTIEEGGQIGIGTATPANTLHVYGSLPVFIQNTQGATAATLSEASTIYALKIQNRASGGHLTFSGTSAYTTIQTLSSNLAAASNLLLNPFGGKVGIGVFSSPANDLHVKNTTGSPQLRLEAPAGYSTIYADSNLYFQPNGTTRMTIKSDGNVGIGDASPDYKLEVAGTLRIDGTSSLAGAVEVHSAFSAYQSGYFKHATNSSKKGAVSTGGALTTWPFPSETGYNKLQSCVGNASLTDCAFPSIHAYGGAGVIGVGGTYTGGRQNIGVLGYQRFNDNMSTNTSNYGFGGYFMAKGLGACTDFKGHYVGVYGRGDIGADTPVSTYGTVTGGWFQAEGKSGQTTYGIQVASSSGTTNYAIRSTAGDIGITGGQVGIGIASPSYDLHVNGTANMPLYVYYSAATDIAEFASSVSTYTRVRINCTNAAGDAQLAFMSASATKWSIGNDGADSEKFKIKAGLGEFSGAEKFMIQQDGNVGIGTNTAGYKFQVYGDILASGAIMGNSKSFVIDHPTKPNHKLQYGALEGPEFGVYHRGRAESDTITLPDYWSGLVRDGTITVQLTPNGSFQHLYVVSTSLSEIKIGAAEGETIDCYYTIYGERADLDPLVVEKIV